MIDVLGYGYKVVKTDQMVEQDWVSVDSSGKVPSVKVWTFLSERDRSFVVNDPVLLSEIFQENLKNTFAYRNLERPLIVDCSLERGKAISLAARHIVVLPDCELAAPYLEIESSAEPFLCFGVLKFIEERHSGEGSLFSISVRQYQGHDLTSGGVAEASRAWAGAMSKARSPQT